MKEELHELFSEGRDKFNLGRRRGRKLGYLFGVSIGAVILCSVILENISDNIARMIFIGVGFFLIVLSTIFRRNTNSKELMEKQKRIGTIGLVKYGISRTMMQSWLASLGCMLILCSFVTFFEMSEVSRKIMFVFAIVLGGGSFLYFFYLIANPPD